MRGVKTTQSTLLKMKRKLEYDPRSLSFKQYWLLTLLDRCYKNAVSVKQRHSLPFLCLETSSRNLIHRSNSSHDVMRDVLFPKTCLKALCRGADWINKTIKKKRTRQGSVISLYSEIHEDDNDLIPFIFETKNDPRA